MPDTFEESVLAASDLDCRLSDAQCMRLCSQHGVVWSDVVADLGDYANHAECLLGWLGY